jgi:hypothetical protein
MGHERVSFVAVMVNAIFISENGVRVKQIRQREPPRTAIRETVESGSKDKSFVISLQDLISFNLIPSGGGLRQETCEGLSVPDVDEE